MQTDPFAQPGTDSEADGGGGSAPDEVAKLKAENAGLREDKRKLTSEMLGTKHSLSPTQIDLLSQQPVDKQAEIAAKLEAERQTPAPAPAAAAGDPAAPPADPPAPAPPADPKVDNPALGQVGTALDGQPVTGPPATWQDDLAQKVQKAQSSAELEAIQQHFRRIEAGQVAWVPETGQASS